MALGVECGRSVSSACVDLAGAIQGMVFATRSLKEWVLGSSWERLPSVRLPSPVVVGGTLAYFGL